MSSAEPSRKKAYSADIGWRVVWRRLGMEMTFKEISLHLQIAPSTAYRIFMRFESTGSPINMTSKQQKREECRKLDDHHELLILALVAENPCLYLREICALLKEATTVEISEPTVCRVLHRNGFTRKKVQTIAKQRSVDYRGQFIATMLQFQPQQFVWVDETGSDARNHIRKFGYQLRGLAPTYHRVLARGRRVSAIAAISMDGLTPHIWHC